MKKFFYAALLPALLFSCNGNNADHEITAGNDSTAMLVDNKDNTMNKMAVDSPQTTMGSDRVVTDKDVTAFVEKASSIGMMEIELGKYATQNAAAQGVKDFGKMMVDDHTAAGDELKTMATSNRIAVPASIMKEEQMHVDMLENKKGAAFDKAYIDMMVNGHKETINLFKKASTDLTDASYKAFALKTLPVLQKHLDAAEALRKTM